MEVRFIDKEQKIGDECHEQETFQMNKTIDLLMAEFQGSPKVVIERGGLKVILFTRKTEKGDHLFVDWNIVAMDLTSKIIWRATPSADVVSEGDLVFTNLYVGKEGNLMAYGGSGYEYVIDESNGQVSRWRDPSFPRGYQSRPW